MTSENLMADRTCRSLEAALSSLDARHTELLRMKEKAEANLEVCSV
jgi:hypothetical protein